MSVLTGPISCPETSVTNQSALCNIPKERRASSAPWRKPEIGVLMFDFINEIFFWVYLITYQFIPLYGVE